MLSGTKLWHSAACSAISKAKFCQSKMLTSLILKAWEGQWILSKIVETTEGDWLTSVLLNIYLFPKVACSTAAALHIWKKDSQWLPIWTLYLYILIYLHRLFPLLFDPGHSRSRDQQSLRPKQESQSQENGSNIHTSEIFPIPTRQKGLKLSLAPPW